MKILIIGGNRFVGLRLSLALDVAAEHELHILNRTGQVGHVENAVIHKGNRAALHGSYLDRDWDVVVDFAAFTGAEVRETLQYFKRVNRYICISSSAVYDGPSPWTEGAYDPYRWTKHEVPTDLEKENLYRFGKRQVEAELLQSPQFPALIVRFPFILGVDDYTERLNFHFERVRDGQPIYFPSPEAKISVIQSEDAAQFLAWAIRQDITGPLNVASPQPLPLARMIKMIEATLGQKAILIEKPVNPPSESTYSPYGWPDDAILDVTKVQSLGYSPKPLDSWLPGLIASLGAPEKSGRLH